MRPPPVCLASFPFNADLTDLILTTLPDIYCLQSFLLCSKFVYNVFHARRASVLRAVVSNHLGPVTLPAMKVLKVMVKSEEDYRQSDPRIMITMQEAHLLAANHEVVCGIESLYSWRNKDPRSTLSRLTLQESARFQMALYRLWFLCTAYGRPAHANYGKRRNSRRHQSEAFRELTRALRSFEHAETVPLFEVWRFAMELATWAVRAEFLPKKSCHRSLEAYLVWSGPRATLQAFQGKLENVIDQEVVPALALSYEQFCDAMTAACPPVQSSTGTGILESADKYSLSTLECKQCARAASDGFNLWSESNWSFLRGIVPPSEFFDFLEINRWNSCTDPDTFELICRDTPYSLITEKVFSLRCEAYRAWKPGHWLCIVCFRDFLQNNIDEFCRHHKTP